MDESVTSRTGKFLVLFLEVSVFNRLMEKWSCLLHFLIQVYVDLSVLFVVLFDLVEPLSQLLRHSMGRRWVLCLLVFDLSDREDLLQFLKRNIA